MGNLGGNSDAWKNPGFSGFECWVSGIGRVSIFRFGSGSGSKKVGLFPRVSGFRVQRPITTLGFNLQLNSHFLADSGYLIHHHTSIIIFIKTGIFLKKLHSLSLICNITSSFHFRSRSTH